MPEVTALPQPGDVFAGKYLIERVIGAGRASLVFSARDRVSGKRVAIEWSLPGTVRHDAVLDDEDESLAAVSGDEQGDIQAARARDDVRDADALVSEADQLADAEHVAIGHLRHPNVLAVYDVGEAHGSRYSVMEWADGESLEARIRSMGRMSVSEATRLLVPCLRGMHEAHAAGIVHRDLKPSNIFICHATGSASEVVKVLDFEVTAADGGEDDIASLMSRRGTTSTKPYYRAPEQFGDVETDHRVDVYAFGAILYELLTGWPPFAPIRHVNREDLTPTRQAVLQARADKLPPGADALVGRAMARDVTQRFQTLLELAEALQAYSRREAASRGMVVHRTQLDVESAGLSAHSTPRPTDSRALPANESTFVDEGPVLRRRPWPRPPATLEDPVIAFESEDEPSSELQVVKGPVWIQAPAGEIHEWSDAPESRALSRSTQPHWTRTPFDTDVYRRIAPSHWERLRIPREKRVYIAAVLGVAVVIVLGVRYWATRDTEVVATFDAATSPDEDWQPVPDAPVAPIQLQPSASGAGRNLPGGSRGQTAGAAGSSADLGGASSDGVVYRLPLRAAGTPTAPRASRSPISPAPALIPSRDGKSAPESRSARPRSKAAPARRSNAGGPKRQAPDPSPAPAVSNPDQLPMKLM